MLLCRRWRITRWSSFAAWTCRSPSRLLMCPRSPRLRVRLGRFSMNRSGSLQAPRVLRGADGRTVGGSADDHSSLQRTMEQNVAIPVPPRGGRHPGLQGFPPRQSSTAMPSSSKKRISERIVEQIVDIPSGGLQDFRPGQSSSSSSHVPARACDALDAPGDGFFFALFPNIEKVRSRVRTRGRNCSPSRAHPLRLLSSVFVWKRMRRDGRRRWPSMKGVCASWTAWCGLTSNSRRRSHTPGALGPATSREGRGRGRRGGNANFQNPLPQFANVPVLCRDMFQQSSVLTVSLLQFFDDVWTFSFVQQRQVCGFMVQKTVVVPQLQFLVGSRHSFRAAEADPHGPVCSVDHGDSAVAAYFGGRCPCCAGRASTTLRIWQSLVWCSPVEYRIMDFSGRKLPDMPYSVLFGSTVDTCLRQSTSSCFLLVAMHLALCSLACRPFVADNSCSTRLLLVTKHLALYSLFPSSGPRCATSWPVWTRRTVRLRWLVLLVTFHLAQCSLPRGQAHDAWHHGWFAQKDRYALGSGMSRLVLLVAMHLALCSSGRGVDFLEPCTQVQGRGSCAQGHGPHTDTACS